MQVFSLIPVDAIQQDQPAWWVMANREDLDMCTYPIGGHKLKRCERLYQWHPGEVSHDFNFAPYTKWRSDCSNEYGLTIH